MWSKSLARARCMLTDGFGSEEIGILKHLIHYYDP